MINLLEGIVALNAMPADDEFLFASVKVWIKFLINEQILARKK